MVQQQFQEAPTEFANRRGVFERQLRMDAIALRLMC